MATLAEIAERARELGALVREHLDVHEFPDEALGAAGSAEHAHAVAEHGLLHVAEACLARAGQALVEAEEHAGRRADVRPC